MKRNIRHILPLLSLFVALFAGAWLVVPHDVCLTKLLVSQGCVCLTTSSSMADCNCCSQGGTDNIIDSGDAHEGTGTSHNPGCFSISSDFSKITSPERTLDAALIVNLVAVLPLLPVVKTKSQTTARALDVADNDGLNQVGLYRDNCVFLI